ncbi:MAG: ribonuclease H-like domain-containing protein [Candidatus Rokubacteria bacterium]|nr:ribonuclease H-like domain-containing protein [Candidatus Rokubacteria bacterium]
MRSPTDVPPRAPLDELRRVIRRIEVGRPPRPTPAPVEQVVGGELVETDAGPLVVVRREYPLSHRHGHLPLGEAVGISPAALELIARLGEVPDDARGLLFLDTETTGLAGGTGTYAFLVGAGWIEGDRFVVAQYFMRDFDEEPALLAALAPLLERASGLVTFNGSGFDVPLLETRFILARRRWPVVVGHVDLLRPARRVWAARFADCRLGTLEREVLGLAREADVPGALIPSLYFDFLRSRRAAPLERVFAHNRDDVLSLVTLLGWFARALAGPPEAVADPAELAGLGRLLERVDFERSAPYYRQALAAGLAGAEAQRLRLRLALGEKRRAQWEAACALWEAAAGAGAFDLTPWEELAKYREHRRRDHAGASAIVARALALADAGGASERALAALRHRQARLERRLSARDRAVDELTRAGRTMEVP